MLKTQARNLFLMMILSVALAVGIGIATKEKEIEYVPGTYYGTASGNAEGIWVRADLTKDKIVRVEILENKETAGICEPALEEIPQRIVAANSPYVDAVSGATKTSTGIKNAVISCIKQATGQAEKMEYRPTDKEDPTPLEYSYNAGSYTATSNSSDGEGFYDGVSVEVTFTSDAIESIVMKDNGDDMFAAVSEALPAEIIKWQTYEVDTVSGATYTSNGLKAAVRSCVEQARQQ